MVDDDYGYDEYDDEYGAYEPLDEDTTLWAMLAHLLTFLGWVGLPFANFLAPLIILLVKGKESEFVSYHAKEALNFQISMFVYVIVSAILTVVFIGFLMLLGLLLLGLICTILAAIAARNGEYYKYPLTFRLL